MNKIPLSEFCKRYSQAGAAKIIGCSQSAVSQMIANKRSIFIVESDGGFTCEEVKRPKQKKAA